jgi:Arc/MetJ-type ribon-helix-helix transcriptional regulator
MKAVTVELPERLARDLEAMVEAGWFSGEGEALRLALQEYLQRHPLEQAERFQQEDIAWALTQERTPR